MQGVALLLARGQDTRGGWIRRSANPLMIMGTEFACACVTTTFACSSGNSVSSYCVNAVGSSITSVHFVVDSRGCDPPTTSFVESQTGPYDQLQTVVVGLGRHVWEISRDGAGGLGLRTLKNSLLTLLIVLGGRGAGYGRLG